MKQTNEQATVLTNRIHSMREAIPIFVRYPSPLSFLALTVMALAWRLSLGDWRIADGLTMLAVFAYWPLQEWFVHKYLLHLRPRKLFGLRIDPDFARRHRTHHRRPHDAPLIFLPLQALIILIPLIVAGFVYFMPRLQLAASGLLALFYVALQYEWIHFMVHTRIQPRYAFTRQLFRHHRLHHYRNEHHWYSFSLPAVDKLMGTSPELSEVPFSPTCRTLDYEHTPTPNRQAG